MPRHDKERVFRQESGEQTLPENEENKNKEVLNGSSKSPETTIDFTPYLREPKYSLENVILPQKSKKQIESTIVELEYQDLIYKDWGMGEKHKLDKALSINLSGPPGTGKTLTAEAFAHSVKKKILVVPYQQLESKYVGETPKNIAKAFEFATSNDAVLFFDEADSFLGKRLENVSQSTDTAVNLTRSVMLLQLSAYEGIVIFATNLIYNYDPAFISRIRWKIQIDLPDEQARAKIWQVQIPQKLPLDKSVDFAQLASQFDGISGRDIKNAVLKAVVSAAKENKITEQKQVTQSHFIEAITEIIAANQASVKPEFKIAPVNGQVDLPSERMNAISN
ncbi:MULTISPECIES: ATP-binding protein [Nostocales]|uniref:ATP-binding protein n=1 Tax=Aphanizomenon flos-aquae FACHB-1040 TaxID=2692887 RepID=A0ABR8BYM5_APHFL|nr:MULTISPECIES: ATP-binding protein [Nostocales]ALB42146.1 ATPase AAA [Anabaena sp. WA102]MBD2279190.1 ATP-binding protein [Aphanizomenon flos-aquae FACHB-1040]